MKTRKFFCHLKRTAAFLLALAMVMGPVAVYGSEDTEVPTEETPAEEGDFKEATVYAKERTSYFLSGSSTITYNGNKVMNTYADTLATQKIDKVTSMAMLERYYNGQWEVYKLLQVDERNALEATASFNYTVPGGYYYRAHGVHITLHNNQITRKETVTGSLWLAQ